MALFSVLPSTYSVIYSEKICPLFGQISITCLKCSRTLFCLPLIAKRCAGDEVGLVDKMNHAKKLDDEIFELKAENDLTNCLVRNDEVFELFAAIEEKLIEKKETLINTDNLENISNDTRQLKCKLPKLVIKEFNGNVLNWQTFWDQFESTIHSKINLNYIDKFSCFRDLEERRMRIAQICACVLLYFLLKAAAFDVPS